MKRFIIWGGIAFVVLFFVLVIVGDSSPPTKSAALSVPELKAKATTID